MTKKDDSILSKIWDTMQMIGAVQDQGDAQIVTSIERLEEKLYILLNGEGEVLFKKYIELSSELKGICEREAFTSGVRFATAYLSAATKNIPDRF